MLHHLRPHWPVCVIFVLWPIAQAHADGPILITQAKALAGNITPGDDPGFPVSLTRPGSYELASNLKVPAGKNGIAVTAHDVTIDLKGFRIYGSNVAIHGVIGETNSTTVRNGTVALFKENGVDLSGDYAIVEHMRIVENGGIGIALRGHSSLIQQNIVSGNFNGVIAYDGSLIQGNAVTLNKGRALQVAKSTVVSNNITSNGGPGIYGWVPGFGGIVGYGNNTLVNNNGGSNQVELTVVPLHPNACSPPC